MSDACSEKLLPSQEHYQEYPVTMAMLICNALKEEKKILNMAIKTEVLYEHGTV